MFTKRARCFVLSGLLFGNLIAGNVLAGCGPTTFSPVGPFIPSGTTHNAYFLTDPSGQQRAVFDLVWGGTLASLKYNNVERVWGNNPGAMVQTAWHALSPDYNPTQAGDVSAAFLGSTVIGVRCVSSNTLVLYTSMLDFNRNLSGAAPFLAVKNGSVPSNTFATPYTIVMTASFVANSPGPPAYYLRLRQVITNISNNENLPWGFEFANYVPGNYIHQIRHPASCSTYDDNCQSPSTPNLLAGMYPNAQLTNGVAFYSSPEANWGASTRAWVEMRDGEGPYFGHLRQIHMWNAFWGLEPGTQRTQTWYALAGDWQKALAWAQTRTNLAPGKPTIQSSLYSGGSPAPSQLAADGNTDGNYFNGSVTHTGLDPQAWWQVDLGSVSSIDQIKVWNRTECCPERLSDFYVLVSEAPFTSTDLSATLSQPGVSSYRIAGTAGRPSAVTAGVSGRYVRVQLSGTNYLSISEVEVFGRPGPPP